jgi:DNA mismatch repair protein MutL
MGKVQRLPPELANQIAAGEVVERPASVVKELLENALDAGARRIAVTVELGGKKLVRVEDDGEGMSADDARTALERHATSKLLSAEDLARIETLGFRGEALPAVASVSRFLLRTRARDAAAGTQVRVEAGVLSDASEVGMPTGTSIDVADLFFNLPARRKFLKSDAAESAQVSRLVTQMALGYPEVGFTLTSAGRTLLQCPPVQTLRDRLYQVYGERDDLVEVRREGGDLAIHGWVAALAEQGPHRGPQNVFVNRRIVKDRTMAHAIGEAYSVASIRERSPEVHLFLEMPADRVDVNVHPTKAEVRFRDQSHVHQFVRYAVGDALGRGAMPAIAPAQAAQDDAPAVTLSLPHAYAPVMPSRWTGGGTARGGSGWEAPASGSAQVREAAPVGAAMVPDGRPLMPLGQFRDTFIVAVDDEGVVVIDQHVAHERVLFERITERLTAGRLASQRLLEPLILELSVSGREALTAHASDLDRLGFEVDAFGGDALRVSAFPALLSRERGEAALRALAEDLEGLDRGAGVEEAIRRMAATMACHAAVRAHDPLTAEKMAHILEELRRTAYSTVCPHGRPVMLRLSRREIERSFERI